MEQTRNQRSTAAKVAIVIAAVLGAPFATRHQTATAQQPSMAQDASLNNLRHPPGTETLPAGTLGNVRRVGEGKKTMLLIAGIGFGDGVWTEFMERRKTEYTMFAVTLPGFGGAKPLAMPADETKFGDTPWMRSSLQAINTLLDKERIEKVTVVAHWMVATQLALQLALDQPARVEAVILIGGALKMYFDANPATLNWAIEQRRSFSNAMGERWFKTVTRRTWDDNNFMPYDYAVNPRRGLFLWREAQAPTLPVWIRYLLEFYSTDYSASLKDLRVPVLVVHPDFDDPTFYVEDRKNYMRNSCIDSWKGAAELNNRLTFVTIPKSRLFIQYDQPEALDRAIAAFPGKAQK
jgi:pimeloyl-ACP methyl ester carboxylesterase